MVLQVAGLILTVPVTAIALGTYTTDWIPHKAVVPFTDPVSGTNLAKVYQPYLKIPFGKLQAKVSNKLGCVPFPAVNALGQVSHGLKPSGPIESKCSKSIGQVYARTATIESHIGIMFAWYYPKFQFSIGEHTARHLWQWCVIWIYSEYDPRTYGISCYDPYTDNNFQPYRINPRQNSEAFEGTRIKLCKEGLTTIPCSDRGGEQPLVLYDDMTQAAKVALNCTDFGDHSFSKVPFNDLNFEYMMREYLILPSTA